MLAVLWTITALAALTGVALAVARTGSQTTRNRILLARAEWAREACIEILLARYAQDTKTREVPVVDLGRGTWCRARLEDPGAKLNVNEATEKMLQAVLRSGEWGAVRSLLEIVLARQRTGRLDNLAQVPGLESYETLLTTRGTGAVNVNAAPREVLRTLPGVGEEAVRVILGRRERGPPLQNADELAGGLTPSARHVFLAEYAEFIRATSFAPVQLVAIAEGGVRGTPITARATLTVVPVPERLAVIRREVE